MRAFGILDLYWDRRLVYDGIAAVVS